MHSRGVEERIPLGLCSNLIPLTFELRLREKVL